MNSYIYSIARNVQCLPNIEVESYATLEWIALLLCDFNRATRRDERVDEVSAEIGPMIVLIEKRMPAWGTGPRRARFDPDRAQTGTHFLKRRKLTADEIQMQAAAVHIEHGLIQDLIRVCPSLRL